MISGAKSDYRVKWRILLVALGLILLALGCARGNYATQKSPDWAHYEADPTANSFGPPGG
jgi:hypothetical protein